MLVAELIATMRFFITMALLVATIAASPGAYGYSAHNAAPLAKSPAPVSTECWIYEKIYPATRAAFASQEVAREQQLEIMKWARPASPAQTKLRLGKVDMPRMTFRSVMSSPFSILSISSRRTR